ncbi:MAG: S8 family serine peptidase [Saprospiraceae bacterium]|nr:S8 family serine peptidase [Saprospiraceae bacterium]MDW8229090.1 S8 family serine peptidase [Saprospiraceae bacterium]
MRDIFHTLALSMARLLTLLSPMLMGLPLLAQSGKIDPELAQRLAADPMGLHQAIVVLADQVNTRALLLRFEAEQTPLAERSYQVITQLQAKAAATQPAVLDRLRGLNGVEAGSAYPVWIVNAIYVRANAAALTRIASWPEVGEIVWNAPVEIVMPVSRQAASGIPNGKEPGLAAIKAPFMWNLGYTGYGRKALVIDTGNDADHPAMRANYWGHQVPRWQAWSGSGQPEDCAEHGTHVTGTVCGIDRLTNDTIGVAFDAHWMGGPMFFPVGNELGCASSFNQTILSNVATMQWALDPDGNVATTNDQPDVVNCSWRASPFSCGDPLAISILNALEAAGIGVVWAAGNNGPNASTVDSGAAMNMDLVNTFAVGAVNGANPNFPIADFSSRGPSPCGGSGSLAIKPEVVAPGVSVRSAVPGTGYQSFNGTSMAAPHVSGAMLLLRQAFPNLSGIQLKLALYFSARDLGLSGEDNTYGRGMIDLEAAYNYLIQQGHTPAPAPAQALDVLTVNVQVSGRCLGPVNASVTFENAGTTPVTALEIRYGVVGTPLKSFAWTGNLQPNTSITVDLPPLDGVTPGEREYVVELHNPNGQADDRPLNNRFKRTFEMANEVYPRAEALQQQPICSGARVLLEYKAGLTPQEDALWFNTPLVASPIARGPYFLTPPLTQNTTYYVSESAFHKVGRPDLAAGTNSSNSADGGLVFNALKPFVLRTVKVYADQTGVRTVRLLDKDGNVIVTRPVVITQTGEVRISLNINVPKAEKLALVLTGANQLRHSVGATGFPYIVPGVVNITAGRTPAGASTTLFYYYYFDWEIEVPSVCGRTAVPIEVKPSPAPTVSFTSSTDTVLLPGPGTVTFTDQTPGATSWLWLFGNSQTGTAAQETATYQKEGIYRVRLIVGTADGCSNVAEKDIVVRNTVSASEVLQPRMGLSLFPNPVGDQINIVLQGVTALPSDLALVIVNALGQIVFHLPRAAFGPDGRCALEVSALPPGYYAVLVRAEGYGWATATFARQ